MKMTKGKTKRILLSLLMCSCFSTAAYADDYTYSWDDYAGKITSSDAVYTYTDSEGEEHEISYKTVNVAEPGEGGKTFSIATDLGNGTAGDYTFTESAKVTINGEEETFNVYYKTDEGEHSDIRNVEGSAGEVGNVTGYFENRSETIESIGHASAIYNIGSGSSIGTVTAGFINCGSDPTGSGESSIVYGGAVYNGNSAVISKIDGSYFMGNAAVSEISDANGGAIYNSGGITDGISGSFFIGNTAKSSAEYDETEGATNHYAMGGAIYNDGSLGNLSSGNYFIGNSAASDNVAAYGGAIYNNSNCTIGTITGNYFIGNSAETTNGTAYGGAIYNNIGSIGTISESYFVANTATTSGGAIYSNAGSIGAISESYFSGNSAGGSGGAIFNSGSVNMGVISESYFLGNSAGGAGGAINNSGSRSTIEGIAGSYFVGNTATSNGGVINNAGTINSISESYFSGNKANASGGVISNSGTIGSIKGSYFTDNTAVSGGAIYNNNSISITESYFAGNSATNGGAVYNNSAGSMESISGSYFANNTASSRGGAIYNLSGSIKSIEESYFTGNTAANGGAIYNLSSGDISVTGSYFVGNSATASGGAVYNLNSGSEMSVSGSYFAYNTATASGGAVYNTDSSEISITGSYFLGNSAASGGAVFNSSTSSIEGIEGSYFVGNSVTSNGGAIYNGSSIGSVSGSYFVGNNAETSGGAIYNTGSGTIAGITGSYFWENSSTSNGGAIYNSGEITDDISGSNIFHKNTGTAGGAIFNSGTIAGDIAATFEENEATGKGGAIFSSGSISGISGTFTSNTAAAGGAIYNEGTAAGITGSTFTGNAADIAEGDATGGAIYNSGEITDGISGSTFSGNYAKTGSGEAKGGAIYNEGTIGEIVLGGLTGNYAEGATSAMGGAIYDEGASEITVDGDVTDNYVTASSGDALGGAIYAGEGTVVTLSGNITGNSATGTTAKGGAIYNAGEVNINVENKDAVISGNTTVSGGTEEANVLYGEAASVTNFNLTDATLRVDDGINGETGYEINVKGNGTDATTFYMYNDFTDSSLSFAGTTLNTINNEVKTYSVNKFTVAGDFNMVADVDLANETMDRFVTNGNNYGDASGSLNVAGMNLISDTEKDRVGVYFAEPGLKENVTSSVGALPGSEQQTAYSPLYKYNVSYDKNYDGSWGDDGGYFVFDKDGNNPAAMIPPVAQLGAFNAMSMIFEYCFEHSDYYMKLPSEVRLAIREKAKAAKAAKLAEKNGTTVEEEVKGIEDARAAEMASREGVKFYDHENVLPQYDQHELTRPGAWVKPFASTATTPFKGHFTARDKYYGMLIGVDTDVREQDNGWASVFTGYAGYQGIHQSFSGGTIRQDGGVLGVTETFYKKNFYTAWTAAVASTRAKGRTMYGHESSRLYTMGIAAKSGWNLEYDGGKYAVLPTFMASYTNVDMRSYTNAAGLKMDASDLRAVQLKPNVKWIRNMENGWQPYLTVGEIWTVSQRGRVRADGNTLDQLCLHPYTEYGIGVQKRWANDYDGYAEFLGHAGGRRGALITLGFRWTFN